VHDVAATDICCTGSWLSKLGIFFFFRRPVYINVTISPKNEIIFSTLDERKKSLPAFAAGLPDFLLVQHTKTGRNIPNYHKIYPMATKYTQLP
jgi:hypothetical protein